MKKNRRNRRNKRSIKVVTQTIEIKTFFILLSILIAIIIICLGTIFYRKYQDKITLAKQMDELNKQIEDIFTETIQNISDSSNIKRDSIISLSAVGDILCENEIIEDGYMNKSNSYNFDSMFQNITKFLSPSDIVIGTMETNFVDKEYSGYGLRNSPKEFAEAVKKSGVNLVSTCTNHSLDYGVDGLRQTKSYLENLGYSTVGDNLGENRVTIKEVKNAKIAFLSYTCVMEKQSSKTKQELQAVNMYSEELAKQDLEYAKQNSDFIFVIMHWGDPYAIKPSKAQEKIADYLIENGANVILGNHSAAIQPMEIRQNKEGKNVLIAYSLGNYICADNNDTSKVELVLNIQLRKSGEDGNVTLNKVDYTPIYVLDNGNKAENRFELIDMKGVAKAYANGEKVKIKKATYNKLIDGLKLLKNVIEK